MLPGPDRVVACPRCKCLARSSTLASGNTIGARFWTDGYSRAPMLPRPPEVVVCRGCRRAYWLGRALEVGSVEAWAGEDSTADPAWLAAPCVEEPTEGEYHEALTAGLGSDDEERKTLRTLAWWSRNHEYRDMPPGEAEARVSLSADSRRNLEALASLLDENDEGEAVMKAEVFRELGEFDAALEVLLPVKSPEIAFAVRRIRALCVERSRCVRELAIEEATCPSCDKPLRTSRARQCRFCGADWHE